jgi:asparagine synthase (glutamine-hydrolysing)
MEGILPPSIQWRTDKSDISASIRRNLLKYEREILEDVIFNDPSVIEDYVDVPELRAAYVRYAADPMGCYEENFSILLAVNLALWLRNFKSTSQFHGVHESSCLRQGDAVAI